MGGIRSIGWYLPEARRSVGELAHLHGLPPEALRSLQVEQVTVAGKDDHPSAMGARATARALAAAGLRPDDVELLIFCGMMREYPPPWVGAFGVLHELGLHHAEGFDLSARCPGVITGLSMAATLVQARRYRTVAVVAADRFDHAMPMAGKGAGVSTLAFSAGAAAALVTHDAANEIVGYTHLTHQDLALHRQNGPRAGGTRIPIDVGLREGHHLWRNDMSLAQAAGLRAFHAQADRTNLAEVCRQAGFEGVDFVVCAPLDVDGQRATLRALGVDPDRQTFFALSEIGHLGPADLLVNLGLAVERGRTLGRRIVMMTRSTVNANAIAIRAAGETPGIEVRGGDQGGA